MATSATGQTCDVCCHEASSWAVGECDHPTCLRCMAKLRVLCDQKECPVCRLKLDMVFVCREVKPFSKVPLARPRYHGNKNYGMMFETNSLYQEYESLRQNICNKCDSKAIFRTFKQLRSHTSKAHGLHYCDICVDSLKLFPSEFKVYTHQLLTKHRRDGDADDSSYKGHPMCKFCDTRFLDNDVLHAHLRTDHLWCHICESNGRQDYYKDYPLLRKHFREEHFLCEEGPCREEKLTCVFRSKIDFQAHRAATHTRGLSKAEVKQMKQVELGFSYSSGRGDGGRGRAPPLVSHRASRRREQEELEIATALSASASLPPPNDVKKPTAKQTTSSTKKSPVEESKPPPGFPGTVASAGPEMVTNTRATVEITHTGFDPYSNIGLNTKPNESELSKPPGFESVIVPLAKQESKVEKEWPEIAPPTTTLEPSKQKYTKVVSDSELTGLQKPSYVYGGPSSSRAKTEKSEPKKKSSVVVSMAPVPEYTAEAFPSLSSKIKPVTQEKTSGDDSPSIRKKAASSVVEEIRSILDKTQFTKFKTLSGWYRNNEITGNEYMTQCSALFGPKWNNYGPKVASVFPEKIKQLELMALIQPSAAPVKRPKSKKKAKERVSVWSSQGARPTRGMLNDSEYPSLGAASGMQGSKVNTGAWNTVIRS